MSQNLRTGELRVEEVPAPLPGAGEALVRVHASLVSAGTERAAAQTARKSLIGKALDRPGDVRQVIDKVRRDGLAAAYQAASARLDTPLPLGYSAAGIVAAVGEGVDELAVGDAVACAGQGYASHAEWVTVPRNLCARIPLDGGAPLSFDQAAFATVGAIALHAVRQAEARIGESIAVVGLGLVGNLAARLLAAAGCRVLGVEPDERRRALAAPVADVCAPEAAEERARALTAGVGVDAVIIAASSADDSMLESAALLCRDRGRLIVLGAVPLQGPRELLYRREIELRISRSLGPGRYDPSYEERGIDYPIGYVRWTERRNLEAFLELARGDRLGLASLVTHRFPVARAAEAYELLVGAAEPSFAILIEYPEEPGAPAEPPRMVRLKADRPARFGVGFLGAGNFAQAVLLPAVAAERDVALRAVVTRRGLMAKHVAGRFGFERAATEVAEILGDPSIEVVFVAGPNSTHAPQVIAALGAGKHVFTEKPLCLKAEELPKIEAALDAAPGSALTVGFNRRFAPAAILAREHFAASGGPQAVVIRVNAGPPAAAGWAADREGEGGRVLGEVCHFVDLLGFFFGAPPIRVHATRPTAPGATPDDVLATLEFAGGRIGTIAYVTSGSARLGKEQIELFGGGRSAVIDDFRILTLLDRGVRRRGSRWSKQDKGHRAEVAAFFAALRGGGPPPIAFGDLASTMRATFAIEEAVRSGIPIVLRR